MYTPPASHADEAESLSSGAARGLGLVIAAAEGRTPASPLPFYIEQASGGRWLAFHVARGNRLAELAASGGRWVVAGWGAGAHVSPRWDESPDQVPAWRFESLQAAGAPRVRSAPQQRDPLP